MTRTSIVLVFVNLLKQSFFSLEEGMASVLEWIVVNTKKIEKSQKSITLSIKETKL